MSKHNTFRKIRGITDQQLAHTFGVQHQSLLWLYKRTTGWRSWAWVAWAVFITAAVLLLGRIVLHPLFE